MSCLDGSGRRGVKAQLFQLIGKQVPSLPVKAELSLISGGWGKGPYLPAPCTAPFDGYRLGEGQAPPTIGCKMEPAFSLPFSLLFGYAEGPHSPWGVQEYCDVPPFLANY